METIEIGNLRWVVAPDVQDEYRKERLASRSKPKAKPRKRVSQAKQIIARAKVYGAKNVRKVGNGGLITQPIETNGWLAMPSDKYEGIIPREGLELAETLIKGIPIKGFLVADDKRAVDRRLRRQELINRVQSVDWSGIASGVAWVAGTIAVVGAIIWLLPAVFMVFAIGMSLTLYDPLLIAVTEDDEWICVYEWWD